MLSTGAWQIAKWDFRVNWAIQLLCKVKTHTSGWKKLMLTDAVNANAKQTVRVGQCAAKRLLFIASFPPCNSCSCARGWVHVNRALIHSARLPDARSTASRMCDEESHRHDGKHLGGFISALYLLQPISPPRSPRPWMLRMQAAAVSDEKNLIKPQRALPANQPAA